MIKKIIYIYFTVFLLNSCSIIKKNQNNRIEHYAVKLAKKNGNSYYVKYSSPNNYGVVWSYGRDSLYIYEIKNGRLTKRIYKVANRNWVNYFDLQKLIIAKNCEAIDAEIVGQYKYHKKLTYKEFIIDINCISKKVNEFSGIDKEFASDLTKYYIILLTQEDIDILNRKN